MRISVTLSHGHIGHERSSTPIAQRVVAAVAELVRKPIHFYRSRAELNRLGQLSDHELNDIGLMRSDIVAVSALPLGIDPTAALASMVEDRHKWRRGL